MIEARFLSKIPPKTEHRSTTNYHRIMAQLHQNFTINIGIH
jgi:hypothetical protein